MSTLAEIEAAADSLPPEEKQELLLFLAASLRNLKIKLPPSRSFAPEEIAAWIAEDEADLRRFQQSA